MPLQDRPEKQIRTQTFLFVLLVVLNIRLLHPQLETRISLAAAGTVTPALGPTLEPPSGAQKSSAQRAVRMLPEGAPRPGLLSCSGEQWPSPLSSSGPNLIQLPYDSSALKGEKQKLEGPKSEPRGQLDSQLQLTVDVHPPPCGQTQPRRRIADRRARASAFEELGLSAGEEEQAVTTGSRREQCRRPNRSLAAGTGTWPRPRQQGVPEVPRAGGQDVPGLPLVQRGVESQSGKGCTAAGAGGK